MKLIGDIVENHNAIDGAELVFWKVLDKKTALLQGDPIDDTSKEVKKTRSDFVEAFRNLTTVLEGTDQNVLRKHLSTSRGVFRLSVCPFIYI